MYIKTYGGGGRIFLSIHGWSGTHATFFPLVKYTPAGSALVCPDLPGYGESRTERPQSLAHLAGLVSAEMEAIGSNFTFVGNCSGALIGLAALEAVPALQSRVERMVLIDPFAYTPWYFKLFLDPRYGRYAYYSAFANPIGRWLTNYSLRKHRSEETDMTNSFRGVDHDVSYKYLEILDGIGSIDRWSGFEIETDLILGERTFGAVKDSIEMWCRIWPHAHVHMLPGAGHLPILEATRELSTILFR